MSSDPDLLIRLRPMRDSADDWTKVTDLVLRKKLQNRLAQRKRRKLICILLEALIEQITETGDKLRKSKGLPSPQSSTDSPKSRNSPLLGLEDCVNAESCIDNSSSLSILTTNIVPPATVSIAAAFGLDEHRYLSLMHYSHMRAFIVNAEILGLDLATFHDDETLSPWNTYNPYRDAKTCSHSLAPTSLQLSTLHHPFLDILAPPGLRDMIVVSLATMSDEQEFQLCIDVVDEGFIIWGNQPWNSTGWEVTSKFAKKYWWLLDDQTIQSTNFWRLERGEQPLQTMLIEEL